MYENYRITDEAADKIVYFILPLAREYFKDPKNWADYEAWHLETYGETHEERQARLRNVGA